MQLSRRGVEIGSAVSRALQPDRNGLEAAKPPESGLTESGVEPKAERAVEPKRQEAKWQVGSFDPGMGFVKAEIIAGE
jgi:hypothetical protein